MLNCKGTSYLLVSIRRNLANVKFLRGKSRAFASKFQAPCRVHLHSRALKAWLVMTRPVEPVPKIRCNCPGGKRQCGGLTLPLHYVYIRNIVMYVDKLSQQQCTNLGNHHHEPGYRASDDGVIVSADPLKAGYSRLRSMMRHCSLKARALLRQCMVVSLRKSSKSIDAWRMKIRCIVTKLRHPTLHPQ